MKHGLICTEPAVDSGRIALCAPTSHRRGTEVFVPALQSIKVLESARVPVVKFTVPGPNTHVDVTINNLLPLRNTALIAAYCAIDARLSDMIFIVKHWAKARHIADAYQSTLSSYAWVLMCIFIAQKSGLVPVLQREEPWDVDEEVEVSGKVWKCQFNTDVKKHAAAARSHWITTGGLLTMFFDYFATRCVSSHAQLLLVHRAEHHLVACVPAPCQSRQLPEAQGLYTI
jgi:hypothetical protein